MPKYYLYRSCYLGDKYLWNNFYRVIRLSNLIMSVDLEHHKISMGVKYFLLKKLPPLQLGLWVPLNYVTFIQGWGLNTCLLSAYPFVCNIKIICRTCGSIYLHSRSMFTPTLWNNCMTIQNIFDYTSLINWALLILSGANPVCCWQTGVHAKSIISSDL